MALLALALHARRVPPRMAQVTAAAPSWDVLSQRAHATPTGARLKDEAAQRALGRGPPHADASLRLFDAKDESQVRVTLYRDAAAWCPYCQKTWLLLEEKRIPYRVVRLNMNAYGYKPAWYTQLVDGGKLPAIELDGELHVESLRIMELLDATFSQAPRMVPAASSTDATRASELLQLERELVRDWFSLVFYPVEGEILQQTQERFLATLRRVDDALGETEGPWFLAGDAPSLVECGTRPAYTIPNAPRALVCIGCCLRAQPSDVCRGCRLRAQPSVRLARREDVRLCTILEGARPAPRWARQRRPLAGRL